MSQSILNSIWKQAGWEKSLTTLHKKENENMGKIAINVDYTWNFAAAPANEDIACVVTAKNLQDLKSEMEESLRAHIEWMREDGDPVPDEFEGEWEFEWRLSVRALLHYTEGLLPKSALAKVTGINQQ